MKNTLYPEVIIGAYVFTPCKNAFNDKYSVWLTKEGMTVALYCFTIGASMMSYKEDMKHAESYIRMFQEKFE